MGIERADARAIATPVGLYAHVRSNHLCSLLLFSGFVVAFQMTTGAVLLVPLLLFDPEHAPLVGAGGYSQRYLLPITIVGALLFAVRYWRHLSAVHKDTGFRYVDAGDEPRLCRLLEPLILAAGVRPPGVGVIESPALNAFAAGVRENHTVLVVTRGLLDALDDEELGAVLAHELMHIRFRDTSLLAAANAFLANLTWLERRYLNGRSLEDWRSLIWFVILPVFLPLALLVSFLGQVASRIGFSSRAAIGSAREFIADAEAVRLTQNPAALAAALWKVNGRDHIAGLAESHHAMLIAGAVEGRAATHPTVARRIAALLQTTGPALAYAPLRRDTRTPEQRRQSGFGRAIGQELIVEALEAKRPTLWRLFQQTRDPERNLLGLTRKGNRVVLTSVVAAAATWGGAIAAGDRPSNMRFVRGLVEMSALGVSCALRGTAAIIAEKPVPRDCSTDATEREMDRIRLRAGIPVIDKKARAEAQRSEWRRNRCFPYWQYGSGRSGRVSHRHDLDHPSSDISHWREFAASPIGSLESPPEPGETAAEALTNYMFLRLIAINEVTYKQSDQGRHALNAWLAGPRHDRALVKFREMLSDPAFAKPLAKYGFAESFRIITEFPFEAVPCAKRRADGTYISARPTAT